MDDQEPPGDSLPVGADLQCVLVRSRDVLIGVDRFRLWPSGIQFTLAVRLRQQQPPVALPELVFEPAHQTPSTALMRLAVTAADGRRWEPESRGSTTGLRLIGGAGSGFGLAESGGARFDVDWWLQPLPTGEVIFEVECPQIGVGLSTASLTMPDRVAEPVTFLTQS